MVSALKRRSGVFGEGGLALILLYCTVALIALALVFVRVISERFAPGTSTIDHPYVAFVAVMMVAGLVWTGLIWLIPKILAIQKLRQNTHKILWLCLGVGFVVRLLFLGSTPIYENDWNRYLWDGAVVTHGISPYSYSPAQVLEVQVLEVQVLEAAPQGDTNSLQTLALLSAENDGFADRINYQDLTTIYPPVAQSVFALAALIKPFDLNVLRILFIIIDAVSVWLMVKALRLYGRDPLWAVLYVLNPLVVYAGFNAVHMDIILVPFLLLCLLWIKARPQWAAVALGFAAAVKVWPLLLAPILFRTVRGNMGLYLRCAAIVTLVFLFLSAPILLTLGDNSGLSTYAQSWQRSSFLFPLLVFGLESTGVDTADQMARIIVAVAVSGLSLWLGFARKGTPKTLPAALMVVTLALFLLAPTGYPWYGIWFVIYLPFVPSYCAAFLLSSLALYYTRYAFWEADQYHIYSQIIIPLQFGPPIVLILIVLYKYFRKPARSIEHA